jgi:hypothetical protein
VTELRDHWVRRAFSHREDIARSFVDREHWADADETLDANNSLWKQYALLVDLYKYYLEIAWKVAVWYYATTGAVLAFYFNNVSVGGVMPSGLESTIPPLWPAGTAGGRSRDALGVIVRSQASLSFGPASRAVGHPHCRQGSPGLWPALPRRGPAHHIRTGATTAANHRGRPQLPYQASRIAVRMLAS